MQLIYVNTMRIIMTRVFLFCLLFTVTTIPLGTAGRSIGNGFSNIINTNKGLRNIIEGDILRNPRRTASSCVTDSCKWPKVNGVVKVPYVFENGYKNVQKNLIKNYLSIFKDQTCVEFVPRTDETDYIAFTNQMGCASYVGRQGGKQVVFLKHENNGVTCVDSYVVQHEALHVIGFLHEQNRIDRDDHVTIHWDNIQSELQPNFKIYSSVNLGIPYDYNSILHYSRTTFSENGQPTITANDDYDRVLGGSVLSADDIRRVKALYEC
ncbi:low choriolytic enzyme-like [Cynoglossus semilaevis]|uniref:low choriolytic enzyme-like n=1 Tax=Cynoglossus semilaevis TaxID=244447 RepID=UPI0004952CDD|nr:low choriolytic enzyme-like [Cynoglossus semilaevis]